MHDSRTDITPQDSGTFYCHPLITFAFLGKDIIKHPDKYGAGKNDITVQVRYFETVGVGVEISTWTNFDMGRK